MSFERFLDDIERAKVALNIAPQNECFYRGVSSKDHDLVPSLLWRYARSPRGIEKRSEKQHLRALQEIESNLFWDFSARARELLSVNLTDWEILFTMRHHMMATRLLDWTTVIGVAVYFALQHSDNDHTPCIWLLNPFALNKCTIEFEDIEVPRYLGNRAGADEDWDYGDLLVDWDDVGIGWEHPIAIQAPQRDARLHAQRGYFTIHGNDRRAIDQQVCGKKKLSKFVRCIEMPDNAVEGAKKFLNRAGIDRYLLFPELDSLGALLHQTYGLDELGKNARRVPLRRRPRRKQRRPASSR